MLVFTTLFLAALVVGILYLLVVRRSRWLWLSYGVMLVAGVACLLLGSMHFAYSGIEIAVLGSLVVWLDQRLWRNRPKAKPPAT